MREKDKLALSRLQDKFTHGSRETRSLLSFDPSTFRFRPSRAGGGDPHAAGYGTGAQARQSAEAMANLSTVHVPRCVCGAIDKPWRRPALVRAL